MHGGLYRKENNNMIDYIKIMNLIIAFIKLTPIPIDVNKLLNDSEVITISLPIQKYLKIICPQIQRICT